MARSTAINYQSLWWTAHNHLQENNLKRANTVLAISTIDTRCQLLGEGERSRPPMDSVSQ